MFEVEVGMTAVVEGMFFKIVEEDTIDAPRAVEILCVEIIAADDVAGAVLIVAGDDERVGGRDVDVGCFLKFEITINMTRTATTAKNSANKNFAPIQFYFFMCILNHSILIGYNQKEQVMGYSFAPLALRQRLPTDL